MKKNKENKTHQKSNHNVETPTPPHVMDPSAPPVKKEEDRSKAKKQTRPVEGKKTLEEEKLAPNEEL